MRAFTVPALVIVSTVAASAEGETVAQTRSTIADRFRESWFLGHAALRQDLSRIGSDCRLPGWDGYGALPIQAASIELANRLLDVTPPVASRLSLSVGAEPDGQVTIEWHLSSSWTLSVSVGPNGQLHYSALLGQSSAYGTEIFDPSTGMPEAVARIIRRIELA